MTSERRTMGDQPRTPTHGHPGLPTNWAEVLRRVAAGLPSYVPTDPVDIDQAPYRAYARKWAGLPHSEVG